MNTLPFIFLMDSLVCFQSKHFLRLTAHKFLMYFLVSFIGVNSLKPPSTNRTDVLLFISMNFHGVSSVMMPKQNNSLQ